MSALSGGILTGREPSALDKLAPIVGVVKMWYKERQWVKQ